MVAVLGLNKHSNYTALTRWLHAGLALGAVYQLTTSLILLPPDEKGSALGHNMMEAHELGGLVVAAIVIAHFIWSLFLRKKYPSSIWILFSRTQWAHATSLIPAVLSALIGKSKLPEPGNSLSKVIEMLGLLVVVFMASTGIAIWIGLPENKLAVIPHETEFLMNIHSLASNLLWAYIIGHVCMVVAHARAGHASIKRISPLYNKPEVMNMNELMGFTKRSKYDKHK